MSTRDAYVQKIKAQIDDWNEDINERDSARQKVDQIREASDDAWKGLQASAEDLWDRTNAAFAAAKAEFKD